MSHNEKYGDMTPASEWKPDPETVHLERAGDADRVTRPTRTFSGAEEARLYRKLDLKVGDSTAGSRYSDFRFELGLG